MAVPVVQSYRLMIRALKEFAKKNPKLLKQKLYPYSRKLPKGNIEKKPKTRLEQLEKNFDTKWKMGNAEIRLRELLGQKYKTQSYLHN